MSKNLVFGEKAKLVTIRLYSWEKALVKAYIKLIREKKKEEILEREMNYVRGRNFIGKRQTMG